MSLADGSVLAKVNVPGKYFAEGITIVGDKIYMLTWRETALLIYDLATLQYLGMKTINTYNGEGWGLTYNGRELIASDGTQYLSFYDLPGSDTHSLVPVTCKKDLYLENNCLYM